MDDTSGVGEKEDSPPLIHNNGKRCPADFRIDSALLAWWMCARHRHWRRSLQIELIKRISTQWRHLRHSTDRGLELGKAEPVASPEDLTTVPGVSRVLACARACALLRASYLMSSIDAGNRRQTQPSQNQLERSTALYKSRALAPPCV